MRFIVMLNNFVC